MIRLCRVDHRLFHGQVAYAWMQSLSVNCILISSDAVASDELRMAALRIAKPAGVKLVMKSVADSAAAIESGVTDKYDLMIICETIDDAYRLAQATSKINEIDLGGVKNEEGKRRISRAVCVSERECEQLRELESAGVHCYVQQVPSETPTDVSELI
uniref:PTS sugar transporter subunit IIB n=1 Tax=Olsenella timonensis TaxID=1805478 RepID=UPI00094ED8B3|nr:PTS sugar transporter subunit IIB [Olsenella timonensis]